VSEGVLVNSLGRIPAERYKLPEGQFISLDFAGRSCSRRLILHMLNSIVWEKGIHVAAWLSTNEDTQKLFQAAGLCIHEPALDVNVRESPSPENLPGECEDERAKVTVDKVKFIRGSMRSGQRVEVTGDVIVWGHLNPGAEIFAGGSIIVAGKLLGVVHAGGFGREDVFVWAGCFETPQVRIANKLCYADSNSTGYWRKSVLITLEDGTPVIRENKFLSGDKK
ncbi:MAG: hypothetical protein IJR35_01730, partial [Synergistaceae bacterium]|nr:hypothetical protein [Synergistaceae bacterium]